MRLKPFARRAILIFVGIWAATLAPLAAVYAADPADYVGTKPPAGGPHTLVPHASVGGLGVLPTTGIALGVLVAIAVGFIVVGRLMRRGAEAKSHS